MSMSIITGHTGTPHVTSEQAGAENAAMIGTGRYVFDLEQRFAYEIISNNLVRIKNGYGINQGRTFGIVVNDYEDVTIDNGLAGVDRHDLIVARYVKIPETGVESITLEVIKGTSSTTPEDPSYTTGNILEGAVEDVFPLYRVVIEELTITSVTQLFVLAPSIYDKFNSSGGEMTGAITSNLGVSELRTYTNVLHYDAYNSSDNFLQVNVPSVVGKISIKIIGLVLDNEFELEISNTLSTAPPDGVFQWQTGSATLNKALTSLGMVDKVGFYTDTNGYNPSILIYKNATSLPGMFVSIKEVIFTGTPISNYEDGFSAGLRSTTLGLQHQSTVDIDSYALNTDLTDINDVKQVTEITSLTLTTTPQTIASSSTITSEDLSKYKYLIFQLGTSITNTSGTGLNAPFKAVAYRPSSLGYTTKAWYGSTEIYCNISADGNTFTIWSSASISLFRWLEFSNR